MRKCTFPSANTTSKVPGQRKKQEFPLENWSKRHSWNLTLPLNDWQESSLGEGQKETIKYLPLQIKPEFAGTHCQEWRQAQGEAPALCSAQCKGWGSQVGREIVVILSLATAGHWAVKMGLTVQTPVIKSTGSLHIDPISSVCADCCMGVTCNIAHRMWEFCQILNCPTVTQQWQNGNE